MVLFRLTRVADFSSSLMSRGAGETSHFTTFFMSIGYRNTPTAERRRVFRARNRATLSVRRENERGNRAILRERENEKNNRHSEKENERDKREKESKKERNRATLRKIEKKKREKHGNTKKNMREERER